jgi:flagellar M-ring protein FliF
MSDLKQFWTGLSPRSRTAFAGGCIAILAMTVLFAWWALRAPYGVLFSDLAEQDAGAIVQELDKLKVPYQIGPNGQSILVPEEAVHKTRMALMGRQLPLQGAVGFELFNTTEFGVSDFVQKVNYQRALQGELTRTILSIEQVHSARVHLALPEQGLFRKDAAKAKASVTVVTKPGQSLQPGQVLGMQRLIAASVPDVQADDVTVLDQNGVTLSKSTSGGGEGAGSAVQLDAGPELEARLTRKATQVLDRMFGAGEALVTVDAVINLQHTKVTTEEVLAAQGQPKDQSPAGVLVRERSVTREAAGAAGADKAGPQVTSQEFDYQTGKRVEQVVLPGGGVTRLNVAVVIKSPLDDAQVARVRELIAASVGLQPSRGDVIAVYSMASTMPEASVADVQGAALPAASMPKAQRPSASEHGRLGWPVAAAVLLAVLLAGVMGWQIYRRPGAKVVAGSPSSRNLSPAERDAVLKSVHEWLAAPEVRREA